MGAAVKTTQTGVEPEEKYCEIIANRLSQGAFDFA